MIVSELGCPPNLERFRHEMEDMVVKIHQQDYETGDCSGLVAIPGRKRKKERKKAFTRVADFSSLGLNPDLEIKQ